MGIFSRFRDIINANLNAMLDKAEDPEKMIKLMIQEMEDTLVEMKASCAGAMADKARLARGMEDLEKRVDGWERKARLALEKGRDELAREALVEKRDAAEDLRLRKEELAHFDELIGQYRSDIEQLEQKLDAARNKHRILVQRHIQARRRKSAHTKIRNYDGSDAFVRFEQFESRIDRMEADAELSTPRRRTDLEAEIDRLERDENIEAELEALRRRVTGKEA